MAEKATAVKSAILAITTCLKVLCSTSRHLPICGITCQVHNSLILAPLKDMARRHIASWERGRCPRVGLQSAPGRLGYQSPGITTGAGGASLDWDRRRRVTPVQTASQEAWPEAEPLGWNNSLR